MAELTPAVGRLLDKHLQLAKEWFPHEFVPWGCGRDFVPGEAWDAHEHDVPDGLRSALFVNLLTEDNLPYYFNCLDGLYGSDDAWGTWARQWTAEEGRHSIVLRDYFTVTRLLDLHLPDISGEEVLQQIRQTPSIADTVVVVCSADASPGQTRRLMDAGANGYLTKPVDLSDLFEIVRRVREYETLEFPRRDEH
jgi:CheY-like chemotaxis protein